MSMRVDNIIRKHFNICFSLSVDFLALFYEIPTFYLKAYNLETHHHRLFAFCAEL